MKLVLKRESKKGKSNSSIGEACDKTSNKRAAEAPNKRATPGKRETNILFAFQFPPILRHLPISVWEL